MYPWNATFVQHERALVTVDEHCKIVVWEQTGDDQEQVAVDDAVRAVLCSVGFYGPEECDVDVDVAGEEEQVANKLPEEDSDTSENVDIEETASEQIEGEESVPENDSPPQATQSSAAFIFGLSLRAIAVGFMLQLMTM